MFGSGCITQQEKYCIPKLLPLLSFSLLPAIKSLLCRSLSVLPRHLRLLRMKKKAVCLCTSRTAIHTKRRPKCEFSAFCDAVHVAAIWKRALPEENCVLFSPWFLLSKGSEPFSQKHKRCAVREANGSIYPDSLLFFSLFSTFFLLWLAEKALSGI